MVLWQKVKVGWRSLAQAIVLARQVVVLVALVAGPQVAGAEVAAVLHKV